MDDRKIQPLIIIFNKPFQVLSQFSAGEGRKVLKDYIKIPGVYPAGRLDYDSEGLLLLTNSGKYQNQVSDPENKLPKTYLVQVENEISVENIKKLMSGVELQGKITKPALVKRIDQPVIWERFPPIRIRRDIPVSWLKITITEGMNRQVRRMTASVGNPALRLIRYSIGKWSIDNLKPGEWRMG